MDHYLELPKKGFYYRKKDTFRSVSLITSRGCPENCNFCVVFYVSGKPWRPLSAEYVFNHIKLLVKKYGVEQIHIEDDNFTLDLNRAKKIMDLIINSGLKFRWDLLNGIRADKFDEELAIKMKKAGCTRVCIAPESGSQRVLNEIIDKRMDLRDVVKCAQICKKVGLPLQAFFIIGFPRETKEDLRKTVKFAKMLMGKYNVIVTGAQRATPFFGTRLYKEAKEKGYLKIDGDAEKIAQNLTGAVPIIETEHFTTKDLNNITKELIRASTFYSLKRYLKSPAQLAKRLRNPYLIKTAIARFVRGTDITY